MKLADTAAKKNLKMCRAGVEKLWSRDKKKKKYKFCFYFDSNHHIINFELKSCLLCYYFW